MSNFSYISTPNPNQQQYKSIVDVLKERTKSTPDKEICIHRLPEGGRKTLTYDELTRKSTKLAKYLVSKGISVGDSVAIMGSNTLEWIVGEFAIFMAGAVAVQCQGTCAEFKETLSLLKASKCRAVLLDPQPDPVYQSEMVQFFQGKEMQIQGRENPMVVLLGKPAGVDLPYIGDILSSEEDPTVTMPRIEPESSALIFTTSGSSGVPKMVEFTHMAITNSPMSIFFSTENDIVFSDRPFSWLGGTPIYSIVGGFPRIFTDPKIVLKEEKIQNVWEILKMERCTIATLFPYALKDLLDNEKEVLMTEYKPISIATGGQIPGSHLNAISGKFCENIYSVYGMTETGIATKVFLTADTEVGHVGEMLPGYEAKIIGDDGKTLNCGNIGEIVLRSPWMLKGYRDSAELTKDSFTEGGWFRTGDIGVLTEDGKLFVKGKAADVIKRGTKKILISAVEMAISNFPGIKEVVVVAVPDVRLLEDVCACVILEDDANITDQELQKMCRDKLGDNVLGDSPTFFLMFQTFPRLNNGKMNRISVKQRAMEMLSLC
ncbi:probable sulfoacetate--CoA ligase [Pecten maximus]|uniref:probable sulfoacetate--CoA ligase n=1 Tax=Pecten maximus TaxID=6579 RepID=UPI001458BB1D|nr:probable sulfoacetate--CoA ligase [Pecten maximus]XP_033748740.1 probable sulfoacetate--CoA ligase [Pecten maximus]